MFCAEIVNLKNRLKQIFGTSHYVDWHLNYRNHHSILFSYVILSKIHNEELLKFLAKRSCFFTLKLFHLIMMGHLFENCFLQHLAVTHRSRCWCHVRLIIKGLYVMYSFPDQLDTLCGQSYGFLQCTSYDETLQLSFFYFVAHFNKVWFLVTMRIWFISRWKCILLAVIKKNISLQPTVGSPLSQFWGSPIGFFNPVIPAQNFMGNLAIQMVIFGISPPTYTTYTYTFNPESCLYFA